MRWERWISGAVPWWIPTGRLCCPTGWMIWQPKTWEQRQKCHNKAEISESKLWPKSWQTSCGRGRRKWKRQQLGGAPPSCRKNRSRLWRHNRKEYVAAVKVVELLSGMADESRCCRSRCWSGLRVIRAVGYLHPPALPMSYSWYLSCVGGLFV